MVSKNNGTALWMVGLLLVVVLAVGSNGATSAITEVARPVVTPVAVASSMTTVSLATGTQAASVEGPGLEVIYEQVNPSVVEVINLARAGRFSSTAVEQGLGSGFVWDAAGHIVTNQHVVDGASELQVVFADGTRVEAKLIGTDASSDLAVIKVDPNAVELQPVTLGDMAEVRVGQAVVAIGNPYGRLGTMTQGIVSGLGRTIDSQSSFSIANAIQTDTAINPGNSGGPLLNVQGEVIGVNDQIESTTGSNSGVGFAIPISIVQRVAPALIEDGSYQHAYLGISGSAYNVMWADALGLPEDAKGVYVMAATPGGPAAKAGLRGGAQDTEVLLDISQYGPSYLQGGGDLITAVDGLEVSSMDELMTYLSEQTSPGQTVALTVIRSGGKQMTLEVTLGVQPARVASSTTVS